MERKGCTSLAAVKHYLLHGTLPEDCKSAEKRTVRKRSKAFVIKDGQLFYQGGRPKRTDAEEGEDDDLESTESGAQEVQTLRKCCLTEEEKQEVVSRFHIGEDGHHFGIEKTTERVSAEYYWVGISYTVRKAVRNCEFCIARGIRLNLNYIPRCNSNTSITHSNENPPEVTVSNHGTGIKREIETGEEPSIFFVEQETCHRFWQKVEIQIFGPYSAGRKQVYVAVAMDCYSQFPEATVIEHISGSSLTTFVLNLICRYGVMETLSMLQNRCTKDVYLYINMQDLELAGITPNFLSLHANAVDERWLRISQHLDEFVRSYPKTWNRCLEAFMLPLRVSLPPHADYVPAYLTYNREIQLPEKLGHRNDSLSELSLNEQEKRLTVDNLMLAYGQKTSTVTVSNSGTVSAPQDLGLHMLPKVKLEVLPPLAEGNVLNLEESTIVPVTFEPEQAEPMTLRKRRKKRGPERLAAVEDSNEGFDNTFDDSDNDPDFNDFEEDEDNDETYCSSSSPKKLSAVSRRSSGRKRKPTFKAEAELMVKKERRSVSPPSQATKQSVYPLKRKRGRPPKVQPKQMRGEEDEDLAKSKTDAQLASNGCLNSFEPLDLDLYYLIIKIYKERGVYPPRVTTDFKRAVRRLAETVELKDGKMYGVNGKAAGRVIVMKERQRFCLLKKAHTKGEEHVGRVRALKRLLSMNIIWRGMTIDLDGFIQSCPECIMGNSMENKSLIRIPSLSTEVTEEDHDGDLHMSEDEDEEISYEDLTQYLKSNTFPSSVSPQQQSSIKQRSESFCIVNESLHYKPPARKDANPRLVLTSAEARQEAIQNAHIENGTHISQQDTQVKLRRQYFWSGMTYDIMRFVTSCCMKETLEAVPNENRNPVIQQRIERFSRYYKLGIPDLATSAETTDTSAGPSEHAPTVEGKKENNTEESQKDGETPASTTLEEIQESHSKDPTTNLRFVREDEIVKRAMDAVIVKMGGEKSDPKRLTVRTKNPSVLTPEQISIKRGKTRHKCEHCGRIIKGDVAYKVHLYKHTGIKPFSCNTCGKAFSNRKSLRIHNRKHTGIRPYLCNQCGREFFRSASLRYHLKAHATGQGTPVECDVCGRKFSTQHRLVRHKEFKHPAQAKVFMCNQCGKYFTAARSLKRHEQTHTGIRKYQCQFCSKAFFRKEYLNSHLTNHTEYDPSEERLKPRKKPGKKQQEHQRETVSVTTMVIPGASGDTIPSNVIHWTESDQPSQDHPEEARISLDNFQRHTVSIQSSHSSPSHILTAPRIAHLPASSVSSHTHTIHHTIHHPIAHAARLMNVAGPHGPVSVTVSPGGQPIEVVHTGHGQEILLQHEAVPVQYEVECLSGEAPALTEADLNAIHLLAQASITGQNLHSM